MRREETSHSFKKVDWLEALCDFDQSIGELNGHGPCRIWKSQVTGCGIPKCCPDCSPFLVIPKRDVYSRETFQSNLESAWGQIVDQVCNTIPPVWIRARINKQTREQRIVLGGESGAHDSPGIRHKRHRGRAGTVTSRPACGKAPSITSQATSGKRCRSVSSTANR
jgi:hypothetical protein